MWRFGNNSLYCGVLLVFEMSERVFVSRRFLERLCEKAGFGGDEAEAW